ncbi:hypothetical protein BH24ACT7_BH24ACT7_19680 [soil metagenome]
MGADPASPKQLIGPLVRRDEVGELHYMTHVDNLTSILRQGLLSHAACAQVPHRSVASPEVQARRARRSIPGGLQLHEYVNLYFNARNAMLFRVLRAAKRVPAAEMTILRVAPVVLDLAGVVVTDINAAADIAPRWRPVTEGLAALDPVVIYAEFWSDQTRQRMMAEALIPHRVDPSDIVGAYTVSEAAAANLSDLAPTLAVEVKPYMFFLGPQP